MIITYITPNKWLLFIFKLQKL